MSLHRAAAPADRTGGAVAAVRTTHGRDLAVAPAAGTGQIAVLRPDHALAGAFGTHRLALAVPTGSAGNSAGAVAFFTELHGGSSSWKKGCKKTRGYGPCRPSSPPRGPG